MTPELQRLARADRFRWHEQLFGETHEDLSPRFHRDMVLDLWCDLPLLILLGFRGCAKSTRAEEFVCCVAGEKAALSILFVGPSEARAADRLMTVANHLKMNRHLIAVYGDLSGPVETQTKMVLANGVSIMALGRGQDIRGLKQLHSRPDLVIVDDFEDKENVLTPEGRRQMLRWFLRELRPACHPRRKMRVLATLMHSESVPIKLIEAGWPAKTYPISSPDGDGLERAIWPSRFPMSWVEPERREYYRLGEGDVWELEFMCNAVAGGDRAFQAEMIKVEPRVRTFEAVYAAIDPARTVRRTSSFTGWAVWSWVGGRLIVWEAGAKHLMPDEIIDLAFRLNREYEPVEIGFEEDGLNEWAMQPIRFRMSRDGAIPLRAVKAPRRKHEFIGGLQPFFAAGEASLVREMPDLRDQLLSFPTGRIDAPNALAYSLLLRPGRLIYEGFDPGQHIEPVKIRWGRDCFLAANASRTAVTVVLVQLVDGRIVALDDFVAEGEASESLAWVIREASLAAAGARLTMFAGPRHFQEWNNVGLVQAARMCGVECRPGSEPARGRELLRREIERRASGGPVFVVGDRAGWTLRALTGGYYRPLKDGHPTEEVANNQYKLLMEGLESLIGVFAFLEEDEVPKNWQYDKTGRRYLSAMPATMRIN